LAGKDGAVGVIFHTLQKNKNCVNFAFFLPNHWSSMRLNLVLAVIAIVLAYITCKNLQKSRSETPAAVVAPAPVEEAPTPGGLNVARVIQGDGSGDLTALRRQPPKLVEVKMDHLPRATTSRRVYMSEHWWHTDRAEQPTDSMLYLKYQTKWLKFREDQTFDVIEHGKVTTTGQWNFDEENKELYMSCKDPYINNSWKVKEKGIVMIWYGNTSINATGYQVRALHTKTPPPTQ
jgi:hypothetical protein